MRLSILTPFLLASSTAVKAQNASEVAQYAQGLVAALTAGGYTTLVSLVSSIAATPEGLALFRALPGSNKTLLAPTDGAWTGVDSSITSNASALAKVLSYHLLDGTFSASNVAKAPAHTIARTFLVPKTGSRGQILALSVNSTGGLEIATPWLHWPVQSDFVLTRNASTYQNVHVIGLDQVLNVPPTLGQLLVPNNLTFANGSTFLGAARSIGMLAPVEALSSTTVFLPTDAAFAALNSSQGALLNSSTLQSVLGNHIINSTTLFSTAITANTSFLSLAGLPFTFSINNGSVTISNGLFSAKIVKADVPITNGVVHYIDAVLLNTNSNSSALSSVNSTSGNTTDPGVGPISNSSTPAGAAGTTTGGAVRVQGGVRCSLCALALACAVSLAL